MRPRILLFLLAGIFAVVLPITHSVSAREFLTEEEIEKIQEAQEIDRRVKIYLDAAALRLQEAENRLRGVEPMEGDPLEFFTPEDMLEGYYRILRSVMFNIDDAVQKPGYDWERLKKALNDLKKKTEDARRPLEVLKKLAEDNQKEALWNLVNEAIDITGGAHDGAEFGLAKMKKEEEDRERARERRR
jgi:hypothetical protein